MEFLFQKSFRPDNGSLFYLFEVNAITMALLSETISFMNFFRHYILNYSNNETDEINQLVSSFDIPKCEMLMTYENGFKKTYHFSDIKSYYAFILIKWLATNPNIAQCEWCGDFFKPKTRKKTKYCDGCKSYASKLKHQRDAENDPVLKAFDMAYQRMYLRRQRTYDSLNETPKALTLDEFYEWFDATSEAKRKYLQGEITAEEALKIIEVE